MWVTQATVTHRSADGPVRASAAAAFGTGGVVALLRTGALSSTARLWLCALSCKAYLHSTGRLLCHTPAS